nr:GNAT family N-acetyltransferase [Salsipaludibacter albus]
MDWLRDRVRAHLDPARLDGRVFVARDPSGEVVGHAMVRVDHDDRDEVGLFSTTWVVPAWRRRGVADLLVDHGEAWMRDRGRDVAVTFTHPDNDALVTLFGRRGYVLTPVDDDFVRLRRRLAEPGEADH